MTHTDSAPRYPPTGGNAAQVARTVDSVQLTSHSYGNLRWAEAEMFRVDDLEKASLAMYAGDECVVEVLRETRTFRGIGVMGVAGTIFRHWPRRVKLVEQPDRTTARLRNHLPGSPRDIEDQVLPLPHPSSSVAVKYRSHMAPT